MDRIAYISRANAILLVVNYTADCDVGALRQLLAALPAGKLPLQIALRILLTYLPESLDPSVYLPLIHSLISENVTQEPSASLDFSAIDGVSEDDARQKVRKLHLLPLRSPDSTLPNDSDPLDAFLVHRAHRVDAQTGLLTNLPQLIVPFIDRSENLRRWFIGTLLPLLRHDYEYYPRPDPGLELRTFEKLDGKSAVHYLLSEAGAKEHVALGSTSAVARDLRGAVGPWVYGHKEQKRTGDRRRLSLHASLSNPPNAPIANSITANSDHNADADAWRDVFQWIVSVASKNFPLAVEAIDSWNGPTDIDLGGFGVGAMELEQDVRRAVDLEFARAAFATAYAAPEASRIVLAGINLIMARAASLSSLPPRPDLQTSLSSLPQIQTDFTILGTSSRSMLTNAALESNNPFTTPSQESLEFLHAILVSAALLVRWKHQTSLKKVADLCLFSTEDSQKDELKRLIRNISSGVKLEEGNWERARNDLLWLWRWGNDEQDDTPSSKLGSIQGVFGRVKRSFLEVEVLKALLSDSYHQAAIKIYLNGSPERLPLAREQLEQVIVDIAMTSYDKASNCNRTRGGMKKASDTIRAFYPVHFPRSSVLARAEKLLAATHSLSFYSLTLQHGIPFQPVNIRVHKDPISLLGKVLEQNHGSYTKLDDLLEIGRNMVEAGLIKGESGISQYRSQDDLDRLIRKTERRIIGMAIEAALAEDDFEAAYDFVLHRLSVDSSGAGERASGPSSTDDEDDVSWRVAFQAGRYRPTRPHVGQTAHPSRAVAEIHSLEMRMELLSQALLLAPPAALSGILAAWRRCEEELNALVQQETEEEQKWDDEGDRRVSRRSNASNLVGSWGEASRSGTGEEAPMGLFDVAKGAAAALSKIANNAPQALEGRNPLNFAGGVTDENRVRKRDMVSNMVTGGLASGIGWVLGAAPAQPSNGGG